MENSNHSKVAQHYIISINSDFERVKRGRLNAINIIQELKGNMDIPNLIAKAKSLEGFGKQEHVVKAEKQKRLRTSNNSIQGTIDLLLAGKSVKDISSIRKLGINTVKSHILESLKTHAISLSHVLSAEKVAMVQEAISQVGTNVYDLKEKLGEPFSFKKLATRNR